MTKVTVIGIMGGFFSIEYAMGEEPTRTTSLEYVHVASGETLNVNESTWMLYRLLPHSILNVEGAEVSGVAGNFATVYLSEAVVDDARNNSIYSSPALTLTGGKLIANKTRISSSRSTGLRLEAGSPGAVSVGSEVIISDSLISGVGTGLFSAKGLLSLSGSNVTASRGAVGEAMGVDTNTSRITIKEKSLITGEDIGLRIRPVGALPGGGPQHNLPTFVDIDDSIVQGINGPSIKVLGVSSKGAIAAITVKNNASLLSGNGNLVEVSGESELDLAVDGSRLMGNLIADGGSKLDLELGNNTLLTGNVSNGNDMAVSTGAHWQLIGDSDVKKLTLERGRVSFSGNAFHTLSLNELAGNGTFDMRINLDNAQGDLLQVDGQATGQHLLNVQNTGVEAVPAEFEPLRIVHTEGGDAQFGLIGNRVDLGAYSYLLEKQENDWFIVGEGKTISPSTQSALALFNAAPAIWNSELTTLRSRMGEVRGQEQGSGWIRAYGNRFNANTGTGVDYQQKQQGLSLGADAPISVGNGSLVLGVMGGYSKSDLDLSRGTTGQVNSYYFGGYGTWLSDDGYYVDGVLKLNKFRNEAKVAMSDGSKTKGRYDNTGVGGSVEVGKHIKLADDYFVEPYTQLSGVLVGGDSYRLDNGLKASNSGAKSLLGKVGTTAGRNFTLEDGSVVQPYVRVALAHEFARNNDVKVNETRFDNNLSGSRVELGGGIAVSLSKRIQLHADLDYMKGEHVEQPWGANVGLTLAF
ncbi:autotransporter outer membrane beta-barrel domain-containing protein [Pseudomonas huanghezhanensis]|uniref:autotransporter outer membrane beta-barrel domain-containing protein n=1 Tax=Pseudomonas huanghezhanensis TaxID=3002903 RepID=UPI002285A7B0|nr:autotransporter outer membrane beta-barrel domain-containing protein [Pseudomonas sp. BSw22131]